MSGRGSIPAEIRAILADSPGGSPARPDTPVLPLESPAATASFIDPTVTILAAGRAALGQRDYVAPFATLDATRGFLKIGSSTTIQDHARLVANPGRRPGLVGIVVGDSVAIGDGAIVRGPSTIGSAGGAATSIGANALIDGATIEPGAFVGALARVGPGVVVPAGFRVLPGANVTTSAQASDPSLGMVARVVASDDSASTAARVVADNVALAAGYATLYQGNGATGGAATAGPIPAPISAGGSTIFFGALNNVLGASPEPGSRAVNFEPASGSPDFLGADGTRSALAPNLSYKFPARVVGRVSFGQAAGRVRAALGRGDSIRADEGQPFTFGSIARLGDGVSIHSPRGGIRGTTTTTVTTTTTADGVTTTSTTTSTATSNGAPTATAGTTTVATSGTNAQGVAFTGTVTTTVATRTASLGGIVVGRAFRARDRAVILGGPSATSTFGDGVTVGAGAVVDTSSVGSGAVIGDRAYVANSTVPAGAVVPAGAILVNNRIVGAVRW